MFNKNKKSDYKEEVPLAIRALSELQSGNYKQALPLLDEYISMIERLSNPLTADDGIFYYNRAVAKEYLGDVDGAIIDLERCNKLAQLHQAYTLLGRLQQQKGLSNKSLENIVKGYELGNNEAEEILRRYTNYFSR